MYYSISINLQVTIDFPAIWLVEIDALWGYSHCNLGARVVIRGHVVCRQCVYACGCVSVIDSLKYRLSNPSLITNYVAAQNLGNHVTTNNQGTFSSKYPGTEVVVTGCPVNIAFCIFIQNGRRRTLGIFTITEDKIERIEIVSFHKNETSHQLRYKRLL